MKKTIFRQYDIRGIVPEELNDSDARIIGKAFATFMRRKISAPKIVVGRDNRLHGEKIKKAFIEGLLEHGVQVIDIGACPTPLLYFSVCETAADGGVNITASHNPANYNGFKMVEKNAHAIAGEDILELYQIIKSQQFAEKASGNISSLEMGKTYEDAISARIQLRRPFRIVMDCGSGIAGGTYPSVFKKLGCEVTELYCDSDGNFPHHEPDPIVEKNLSVLKKKVLETKSDLGLAYDGDGDRFTLVDEKGVFHDANESFALLIKDQLSRHPGGTIVYTVSCSLIIEEMIRASGGVPIMVTVGHSSVEKAMTDHKAILGGEQSGHYFIAEGTRGFDDAAYASGALLAFLSTVDGPVSGVYQTLPRTFSVPEFRPFCEDKRKCLIVQKITDDLSKKYPCVVIDGVRAEIQGGWLGVRASNTSPCLSVIMEAKNVDTLRQIEQIARDVLGKHGLGF